MSMKIIVNHCCLNISLYKVTTCSMHSCSHNRRDVITHSTSFEIHSIQSWTSCHVPPVWQDVFKTPCFWCNPKEVVWYCKIWQVGRPGDVSKMRNQSAWKQCTKNLYGSVFCVSNCSKHHCAWWLSAWKHHWAGTLVFKFKNLSVVSGAPV